MDRAGFQFPLLQIDPSAAALHATAPGLARFTKQPTSSKLPIKPAKENLDDLIDANFQFGGTVVGNRFVPLSGLTGQGSPRPKRVNEIANQMGGPEGYIERPIIDTTGNIIEGQHRVEAMRQLGMTHAPVTVVKDFSEGYNTDAMTSAVRSTGKYPSDHVNQLVSRALESIHNEGTPELAAQNTFIGGQWEAPYQAALGAAKQPQAQAEQ